MLGFHALSEHPISAAEPEILLGSVSSSGSATVTASGVVEKSGSSTISGNASLTASATKGQE